MTTRMFILVMAALLLSARVSAEPHKGCAELAGVVFSSVLQSAISTPAQLAVPSLQDEVCNDVAATVSRAFTSAVWRLNIHLAWGGPSRNGDVCLSHFLSQCYPQRHPMTPPVFADEQQFIQDSWRAVQWTVSRRLLDTAEGDTLRFRPSNLGRSLRVALSRSVGTSPPWRTSGVNTSR